MQPPQPCGHPELVPTQQQQQQQPLQGHQPQVPQAPLTQALPQRLCCQLAPMQQQDLSQAQVPQALLPQVPQVPSTQALLQPLCTQLVPMQQQEPLQGPVPQMQTPRCSCRQHSANSIRSSSTPDALLPHQQQHAMCDDGGIQHKHQHLVHGMDVWLLQGNCGGLPGDATAAPWAFAMDVDH
jgi:hypothetical protein